MGTKGQRKKKITSTKYQEPDLLVGIENLLETAKEKGLYDGNSLKIEDVIRTITDLEIKYESMDADKSGALSKEHGKWIICVNKNHNKKRQRFTLAHELGHYFLHKEKNINYVDTTFFRSSVLNSIEFNANEFAARLLMPEDKVRELINDKQIKNIGKLAEQFDVSSAAMKYRVLSLGYKMKGNG